MSTQPSHLFDSDTRTAFGTPPHFDHVFITVDEQTLQGINDCPYLKDEEFGRFLIRESESTLLGRYKPTRIFGENTLVELFLGKFGAGEFASVTAGIVFSFDHVGEALHARQQLDSCAIPYRGELIRRKVPDEAELVPWYLSTRPNMGDGNPLTLFFSEMSADHFARIGAPISADQRLDRGVQLAAALKRPQTEQHQMCDVVAVTVQLSLERVRHVADILKALGYQRNYSRGMVELRGPEAAIILRASEQRAEGLTELKIKLRQPAAHPGQRYVFSANSSLVLSPDGPADTHAVWSFLPRPAGE